MLDLYFYLSWLNRILFANFPSIFQHMLVHIQIGGGGDQSSKIQNLDMNQDMPLIQDEKIYLKLNQLNNEKILSKSKHFCFLPERKTIQVNMIKKIFLKTISNPQIFKFKIILCIILIPVFCSEFNSTFPKLFCYIWN